MRRIDRTTKTYRNGYAAGTVIGVLLVALVIVTLVALITGMTRALLGV
jgi:hypothetical protein